MPSPCIDSLIEQLEKKPFAIIDNFLSDQDHEALLDLAKQWYDTGKFRTAKVGRTEQAARVDVIRRDAICWLDENDSAPHSAIQTYFSAINHVMTALNRAFFLGLCQFETHFARYNPGDFYRKHVDQFKHTTERRISCVYYMNTQWESADAGELQLYDKANQPLTTVAPLGNRFVCFHSDLPHEVYPTQQIRYSATGWLKTRALFPL